MLREKRQETHYIIIYNTKYRGAISTTSIVLEVVFIGAPSILPQKSLKIYRGPMYTGGPIFPLLENFEPSFSPFFQKFSKIHL